MKRQGRTHSASAVNAGFLRFVLGVALRPDRRLLPPRSGQNTYASLNSGWMAAVYSDLGFANTSLSVGTNATTFYNTVVSHLSAGKAVTLATGSGVPNLVSGHGYTVIAAGLDASGQPWFTVRNPWGFSGDGLEDGGGYATLTFAQVMANFTLGGVMAA